MRSRASSQRQSGRRAEAEKPTMREALKRALRPSVDFMLAGLRLTKNTLTDITLAVRERFEDSGGIGGPLEFPLSKLRSARDISLDIARYSFERVRHDPKEPSDHVAHAIHEITLDAANQLIELKKDLAVCIANRKRMLRMLEAETSCASELVRQAVSMDEQGQHQSAGEARTRARQHEQTIERVQANAERLGRQIDSLKRELRSFDQAIQDAKTAAEELHSNEMACRARERVERQLRRIRVLIAALATMSTPYQDVADRDMN